MIRSIEARDLRAFTKAVLTDLRALELVLDRGLIEHGVRRAGVEQEMFLIDAECRPLPLADKLLAQLGDKRFTTELARFNLEANLPPLTLGGDFLRRMEAELNELLVKVRQGLVAAQGDVLLTGILPTLSLSDLSLDNMTPEDRYRQMNRVISELRGGAFHIHIDGLEALEITHPSVMIEAANTSLQLHLQVGVDEFVNLYNLAQLISAPLLAAATNSPILLGHRLWHETRVALFERSVDERPEALINRGMPTRVSFGEAWVRDSVLEIFRDNATRFHAIVTSPPDPDPFAQIARGMTPNLSALSLHNGTVWRWNRPCYGVLDGRAHLRIENRILPAGPTILDEVANAALFYGLMQKLPHEYGDVSKRIAFTDAKTNLTLAAQHGIDARLQWLDGREAPAQKLLLEELIPKASEGLRQLHVPVADIDRYLGTVEARVRLRRTGSRWLLKALAGIQDKHTQEAALSAITAAMRAHQANGQPVHRWLTEKPKDKLSELRTEPKVGDIMTTNLATVHPQDVIDLATSAMEWRHLGHIPVEDEQGYLVGLLNQSALLHALNTSLQQQAAEPIAVEQFMNRNPPTIQPHQSFREAMRLLLSSEAGCLLVVSEGRLVGMITDRDLLVLLNRLSER